MARAHKTDNEDPICSVLVREKFNATKVPRLATQGT